MRDISAGIPSYCGDEWRSTGLQDSKKKPALPQLLSLKLIEASYMGNPQMKAIKEMVAENYPELERKIRAMGAHLDQNVNDFHVK